MEIEDPYRRVRGRIEGTEGNGNPPGRPTVSTNLNPWEFPENELPTRGHTWADLRPQHLCNRGLSERGCAYSGRDLMPQCGRDTEGHSFRCEGENGGGRPLQGGQGGGYK